MEPLRNELKALEDAAGANEKKAEDVETTIGALEKSIAKYKDEYAVLISQAQSIKADLASVEAKVCDDAFIFAFIINFIARIA